MKTIVLSAAILITMGLIGTSALNYALEEIHTWIIPKDIKKNYSYYLSGYDYDKDPVWIFETGKWDVRAVVDAGFEQSHWYKKHLLQTFIRVMESGKNATLGAVCIVDMDGFAARQILDADAMVLWLWSFRELEIVSRQGGIKQSFVVNGNFVFKELFDRGAHLLGDLRDDIEIYGPNPQKWKPVLLRLIPADQLPEHMGGSPGFKPVHVFE